MMPGTANRFANEQSIGEGSTVVRALPTDGVAAAANARHQDRVVTDAPRQEPTFGNEIGRDPDRKVGPRRTLGLVAHL
jgi:hypothetical protein